jgi:hypothetical protein
MRKKWFLALLLAACSAADSQESRFVAKLRDCELLSEGKLNAAIEKEDECLLSCFTAASCSDAKIMVCEIETSPSRAYLSCIEKCGVDIGDDSFACKDGSSDEAYRCDAEEDCEDGSDEKDCPASAFFVCDDGDRVPKDYACDGEEDCSDGEDEKKCESHPGFRCKSGNYVVGESLECDGEEDCEDGSDELKCSERGLTFECDDGSTVSKDEVCNGYRDCEDGSDEKDGCAKFQCGG